MIVCNESHVIRRALDSARPIIDYWVICDTGSADGTPELIEEALQGIPGELHRRPWVNFGHNRTEMMQRARGKADYCLILDADMVVNVHAPFRHLLTADAYEIRYEGDLDYSQRMLVAARHDWHFIGVTHEFIQADSMQTWATLNAITLTHLGDGGMRSDKWERDIRLLTAALTDEPDNARNLFYLAQSYRDIGRYGEARAAYAQRAEMQNTWEEERWYAQFQAAKLMLDCGYDWEAAHQALLAAFAARPGRLEPIYVIVRRLREQASYHLGYLYCACYGHGFPYPQEDRLFIDKPVYDYLLGLEYGICAYGTGRISEAVSAFNHLLRRDHLPAWVAEAALRGRAMALNDLYPQPPLRDHRTANRIVVVSAFHNAGEFLAQNVASLLAQEYDNYELIYIDDASTDGCARYVPQDEPGVRLIRRGRRCGAAFNFYKVIRNYCRPDDIVVIVDGDDCLNGPHVLSRIDDFYHRHDCWVMYSQFQYVDGSRGFCEPFAAPRDILQQREYWRTSHVKTFRAGLFHAIAQQDPDYDCLKNEGGAWLMSAVDVALMAPLIELAGFDRVRYNDELLYIYNDENPMNHHCVDRQAQWENLLQVAKKRPFARIDQYRKSAQSAAGLTFQPLSL